MMPASSRSRVAVERVADLALRNSGLLAMIRRVGRRGGQVLRVLTYHRVVDPFNDPLDGDPGVISATPKGFEEQMRLLAREYEPIGLPDLEAWMHDGKPLPARAVLVTFDDGYQDFLTHAWPVLRRHTVPVVLFVPTGFPDQSRLFWWDELWQLLSRTQAPAVAVRGYGAITLGTPRARGTAVGYLRGQLRASSPEELRARMADLREALGVVAPPTEGVLGWDALRRLARDGVAIASHGRSHSSMQTLTVQEIEQDLNGAQEDFAREFGATPRVFAYPYGHHDPRTAEVLQQLGFLAAFRVGRGLNPLPLPDPFGIFRQSVNAEHSLSRLLLGLSGIYPTRLTGLFTARPPRVS